MAVPSKMLRRAARNYLKAQPASPALFALEAPQQDEDSEPEVFARSCVCMCGMMGSKHSQVGTVTGSSGGRPSRRMACGASRRAVVSESRQKAMCTPYTQCSEHGYMPCTLRIVYLPNLRHHAAEEEGVGQVGHRSQGRGGPA